MPSAWAKTFFRKGSGILNYLLKMKVGRTLAKGKYAIIRLSGQSCTLSGGEKRGEGTAPFPCPETFLSLPLLFLCSQLREPARNLGKRRYRCLPFSCRVLGTTWGPEGDEGSPVSLWFCGSRMFFLVWINLLKQPSFTCLQLPRPQPRDSSLGVGWDAKCP